MSKVTVVYDDLQSSATNLAGVKDYVSKAAQQVQVVKSNVVAAGGKHDNCYKETVASLEDLEKVFANYIMELDFLISQCNAAYEAFKGAEADSTALSEQMKQVLTSLAVMAGMDGYTPDGTELDVHKDRTDLGDVSYNRATAAKRSETWKRIFEDTDSDGDYDKINSKIVSGGTSIVEPTPEPEPGNTPGGGDPGGGNPGGGGNPNYKDPQKKDDPKKEEGKDPVKPTDPTPSTTPENTPTPTPPAETPENTPTPTPPAETPENTPTPTPPAEETPAPAPEEPTYHSGGGYSEGEGYVGYEPETTESTESTNNTEGVIDPDTEEEVDISDGIDKIVKGDSVVTKLPVDDSKIEQKSSGSSVIPIAAGLSAAAAAGLGAKAYMDHKKNNSDDIDEFESDEWSGDESTDFEYDNSATQEEYLDDDDYTASPETETEKYGARNNEELADLQ